MARLDGDLGSAGPPAAGVYADLFREGYRFDFYQAVRLLENAFPEAPPPGTSPDARAERVRFRPDHALSFPAADVKDVAWVDELVPHARVTVTFLGLYGVDAALPAAFFEPISYERSEAEALRTFLDLFNHRLYAYFYRAWKKYRPDLHHRPGTPDAHTDRFVAAAGLGTPRAAAPPIPALRLAAFAGFLGPRVRHAEGLRRLAEEVLDGPAVEIEENVLRWVPLPPRPGLGAGARLDGEAVVGRSVRDGSSLFRIKVGPLDFDAYANLLPGRESARRLHDLVRAYAPDHLEFDVELRLKATAVPRARLGEADVQLGRTACLGTPCEAELCRVVRYNPQPSA